MRKKASFKLRPLFENLDARIAPSSMAAPAPSSPQSETSTPDTYQTAIRTYPPSNGGATPTQA